MAKRLQLPAASHPDPLTEAVQRLAEAIGILTDIIAQLRGDLDWIIKNRSEFVVPAPPPEPAPEPPRDNSPAETIEEQKIPGELPNDDPPQLAKDTLF